jgi:CTP:molybdopterin cytidylyltransferase MocA
MSLVGLLLAAGAGRRMGGPKALLRDEHGVPFLDRAVGGLLDGGCDAVTVVLGAAAEDARRVLDEAGWGGDPAVRVVVAEDWDEGMGASLRAGLRSLGLDELDEPDQPETLGSGLDKLDQPEKPEAALVTLVDLPDVHDAVLRRVVAAASGPQALVRATYAGRPGHPVLIGREHWAGVAATARGDAGARDYLREHPHVACECGDLATGRDLDRPEDLPDYREGAPGGAG